MTLPVSGVHIGSNGARVAALELAIMALPEKGPAQQIEQAQKYYDWLSQKWQAYIPPIDQPESFTEARKRLLGQ